MSVTTTELKQGVGTAKVSKNRWKLFITNLDLYVLLIPGLLFLLLFKYTPMYGIIIAFMDFNIFDGFTGSKWIGLAQFEKLLHSEEGTIAPASPMKIDLHDLASGVYHLSIQAASLPVYDVTVVHYK